MVPSKKSPLTSTGKAVAQFFTPLSKKEPEKVAWRVVDETLLVGEHQGFTADSGRHKIAGFDLVQFLVWCFTFLR